MNEAYVNYNPAQSDVNREDRVTDRSKNLDAMLAELVDAAKRLEGMLSPVLCQTPNKIELERDPRTSPPNNQSPMRQDVEHKIVMGQTALEILSRIMNRLDL